MKLRTSILIFALLMTSCASIADVKRRATVPVADVERLLRETCEMWRENKPLYLEFRAWAIEHQSVFPPLLWAKLVLIDSRASTLDQLGERSCTLADAAKYFTQDEARDWRSSLEFVVEIAGWLKQLGIL